MNDHNYAETNNNFIDWPSDEEILQFRPTTHHHETDDSGVCSPPLWPTSPTQSPSPSHPLLDRFCLSPNSRTQAIARGQKELMEMVKNMPESSYELSLKDLVEHHQRRRGGGGEVEFGGSGGAQLQKGGKNQKRGLLRSEEKSNLLVFENRGLFLKMGFLPEGKKVRRRGGDSNSWSGRVGSGLERDWWKKKFTGSSDSDSSRISSGSATTESSGGGGSGRSFGGGQRKKQGFQTGCWPFSKSRSTKSLE